MFTPSIFYLIPLLKKFLICVCLLLIRRQTMADELKDVIQHLFEIQAAVHGYLGPETQVELVRKM